MGEGSNCGEDAGRDDAIGRAGQVVLKTVERPKVGEQGV
jgi:hypothetical protein